MAFKSLVELLKYRKKEDADRPFITSPEDEIELTYSQFYEEVSELAMLLKTQGLRKNDRIAILLANGLNYAVTFFAIIAAGGISVPINPKLTQPEIEFILENSGASFIITDDKRLDSSLAGFGELNVHGLQRGLGLSVELKIINLPAIQKIKEEISNNDVNLQSNNQVVLLLYTSGTTGRPKGVELTHHNLLAEAEYIEQGHRLTKNDIALCVLPLFHINGLVVTLITPLYSGGRVIMPEKFSASRFWGWIRQYRVTWFSAVPTIFSIILSRPTKEEIDLSSLRFARSASSSLPVAVFNEFEKRFRVPVIEAYGLSEAGSQVATNPIPPGIRKQGSVGIPIGNQLKVADESGNVLPVGHLGEVIVKGENVFKGYYKNDRANSEAFKNGWFCTGDLGYFDRDGYLFLTGRKKELINRAGEKISPREIDEVLYLIPAVEIAAAVGVPDTLYGEEVEAFIKLRPDARLSKEEVFIFCRQHLAEFKVPKKIYFIRDFPKGPNGKIQRKRLLELHESFT